MRKLASVLLILFAVSAWTHGTVTTPQADVVCNALTGTCTGTGGGTALFTAATCNGVADDSAAFASFNSWATGTWQASNTGTIEYDLGTSGTCSLNNTVSCGLVNTNTYCPFINIKNLIVKGYGVTLIGNYFLAAGNGTNNAGTDQAKTNSATSGATFVTLKTAGQTSLFTVGKYAQMTGYPLQSDGSPNNQHYFDYVLVSAKDAGCQGTGTVCFATTPLTNNYLDTWPDFGGYLGGSATLYALDPSWDTTVEFQGITIDHGSNQTLAWGKSITYRDVTVTGSVCTIPSQNLAWTAINYTGTSCNIEADKMVGSMTITGGTFRQINFQSSSIKQLTMSGGTAITNALQGTPQTATISNATIALFSFGTASFGRTDQVSCTNCAITTFTPLGRTDKGWNDHGIDAMATMSGGVISFPPQTTISAKANQGGNTRFTVASTSGYTVGKYVQIASSSPGGHDNGTILAIGAGTIDVDIVFSAGTTYTTFSAYDPPWGMPNTNLFWTDTNGNNLTSFHVTGTMQDSTGIHVATSLSGGFPTGLTANPLFIRTHPAPKFTCSNCTGDGIAVALNSAPAAAPLYSHQTYSVDGSIGSSQADTISLWGQLTSVTYNVTHGSSTAGNFQLSQFNNIPTFTGADPTWTASNFGPLVDMTQGIRTVTITPPTASTPAGTDSLPTTARWMAGTVAAAFSHDYTGICPGAQCPAVTVTVQADQGVVAP